MEEEVLDKKPVKEIIAGFLVMIMILGLFVAFISPDKEPKNIPKLKDVWVPKENDVTYSSLQDAVRKDSIVKNMANKIVVKSCPFDKKCYAKALYYFVRDNFQYVNDPINLEYIESFESFVNSGGGDCESGTMVLANMLINVGIPVDIVLVPGHAFLRSNIEGSYYYMDWTCSNCAFNKYVSTEKIKFITLE